MKLKIFLTFFAILFSICAKAQEVDSLQVNPSISQIDSLTTQLNKLQHDFNYLKCESLIDQVCNEILRQDNSIQISANGVLVDCYHGKFNSELYNTYIRNYDSGEEWLDAIKEKVDSVQRLVALLCLTSNFTETEVKTLLNSSQFVNKCLDKYKSSLNYYKLIVNVYLESK